MDSPNWQMLIRAFFVPRFDMKKALPTKELKNGTKRVFENRNSSKIVNYASKEAMKVSFESLILSGIIK